MTCTKAQLLALLSRIRREIYICRDIKCARNVINNYIELVREGAELEIWRELIRP